MALQSDPSLEGYNSFVSIEEADEHFSGVYFGSAKKWSDIEDEDVKAALLITATRRLNSLPWSGEAYDETQPLAFPRNFRVYNAEYGYSSASSGVVPTIPAWLKTATFEMAQWLMSEEDRPATDAEFAMLKSMKVGPLDYQFRDTAMALPPSVMSQLGALGAHIIDFGNGPRSLKMVL